MLISTLTFIFINIVSYVTIKKDATYQENKLFLVNLPAYALDALEVQATISTFKKELKQIMFLIFIVYIPSYALASIWLLLLALFINIYLIYLPSKKARTSLLALKQANNWVCPSSNEYQVDLSLSSFMEQHPFNLKRYLIVVLIDLGVLGGMLYYQAEKIMYLYMFLQFIALLGGIIFIRRLPNKTYLDNSEVNISLNLLRRNTFHQNFFLLILGDSVLNYAIQFYLLEKLPFAILLSIILIMAVCIIFTLYQINSFYRELQTTLNHYQEKVYQRDDDSCWSFGIFGAKYYNKADPRNLVSIPGGTQLTFNTAKPFYKYFITITIGTIIAFIVGLFGYPYYLDLNHQLVDLSLQDNQIIIASPFYDAKINLDDIQSVSITDDLGKGTRTNGTDAIVYGRGNYTYDNYGKCKVYKASLHKCYIVAKSNDITYIFNDDQISETKKIYHQIDAVINHDN